MTSAHYIDFRPPLSCAAVDHGDGLTSDLYESLSLALLTFPSCGSVPLWNCRELNSFFGGPKRKVLDLSSGVLVGL